MFNNKYIPFGYNLYESGLFRLFEERCIGAYAYMKEIEIILQVVKIHFPDKEDYKFDINDADGCDIKFANHVIINVVYDEGANEGEYAAGATTYDDSANKVDTLNIFLYLNNQTDEFNESKFRQIISHEMSHAYEDAQIRKLNKEFSLSDSYDSSPVDIAKVIDCYKMGDPFANFLYRLYIPTERNAFVTQIYAELCSLYKEGRNMSRQNAYKDIQQTEIFQLYSELKDTYIGLIHGKKLNIGKVLRFFPALMEKRFGLHANQRPQFDKRFEKWFRQSLKHYLNIVWIKICKGMSLFYDDIEKDGYKYTYDEILKLSIKAAKTLFENADAAIKNKNRLYEIHCWSAPNVDYITEVEYNSIIETCR